ncbi:MAG TPA: ABC transporter ATP-binding protein, partial [Myxococcota bacterium]
MPHDAAPTPPEKKSLRTRIAAGAVIFRQLPRTFRILWTSAPVFTVVLAAFVAVQALIPAGTAWVAKLIIDSVSRAARGDLAARQNVVELVVLELCFVVVNMALGRASDLVKARIGQELKRNLSKDVLAKALALEVKHFEDSALYDKMQNARREADVRPLHLVTGAFSIAQSTITLVSYGALLWRLAPWSMAVLVVAAVPGFIAEMRFAAQGYRVLSWRAPEHRRLNYLEWILTRDNTVKEVKLFHPGPLILGRYFELFDRVVDEDRALTRKRAIWGTVLGLIAVGAFYGCYAWVATTAALGALTLGDMTLYLTVFRSGQGSFSSILSSIGSMYEDALYMSNLFAYLDTDAKGELPRATHARTLPPGPQDLELRHVTFKYPGTDAIVLDDLNLVVAAGEKIALVGENGCGKSTLVKLLLRLYEPTSGEILLGGVDIRDVEVKELRARFSAVFQDFARYQLLVGENIGAGDVRA